jgi:predicted metal-dependent peptidase
MNALPQQEQAKFAKPKGDERHRWIKTRTRLVLKSPFFGMLAMRLKLTEAPWCMTAATDGKHLFYNPWYVAALSDDELTALWAHEVMHCTNGHPWRRGQRDRERWNWACDYAIDPLLVDAQFKVPNATVNPQWRGWAAEQIYSHIPVPKKQPQQGGGSGQGQGQGQGGQQGQGQDQQGGGSGGEKDERAPSYAPTKGEVLDADQGEANQQQAEWKQAVSAAAQVAKSQGKMPAGLEILVNDWLEPRVPWKAILRRFVQQKAKLDYSWTRPNKRYASQGVLLPSMRSEQMPPIVIAVDTSGSIGREELAQFAGEMGAILDEAKPEIAYVVYCDAEIANTQEFLPGDQLVFKPKGGGGTSFVPVFEWVKAQAIEPACLIYLTDMYGSFPKEEPEYPVLWASTTKHPPAGYMPPFGDMVFLDIEEE